VKTVDQLDLQAIHRVRDRLIERRTSLINQLRAFLLERGLVTRTGRQHLLKELPTLLGEAEQQLTPSLFHLLGMLVAEWRQIEADIDQLNGDIVRIADADAACRRLLTVPGVGPLTATAMVAAIGNGSAFSKGRQFAIWLGLVPRQVSTGGKPKLLGISKQGNEYLRRLFIHGARSVIARVNRDKHRFGGWISNLESRAHANVVSVALANKLARIAWAVLSGASDYRPTMPIPTSAAA
jgi:transposase